MVLVFHKLHITDKTVGVPNNLLYLQNVYTVKHAAQGFDTVLTFRIEIRKNNVSKIFLPSCLEVVLLALRSDSSSPTTGV